MNFQTELETDVSRIKDGTVLDVDFNGDGFLVVTSTGASLGNPDSFDHNRDQYEFKQGNLRETGTRPANLTIQSMCDRFGN